MFAELNFRQAYQIARGERIRSVKWAAIWSTVRDAVTFFR
jgi:hypothetical protein